MLEANLHAKITLSLNVYSQLTGGMLSFAWIFSITVRSLYSEPKNNAGRSTMNNSSFSKRLAHPCRVKNNSTADQRRAARGTIGNPYGVLRGKSRPLVAILLQGDRRGVGVVVFHVRSCKMKRRTHIFDRKPQDRLLARLGIGKCA